VFHWTSDKNGKQGRARAHKGISRICLTLQDLFTVDDEIIYKSKQRKANIHTYINTVKKQQKQKKQRTPKQHKHKDYIIRAD